MITLKKQRQKRWVLKQVQDDGGGVQGDKRFWCQVRTPDTTQLPKQAAGCKHPAYDK